MRVGDFAKWEYFKRQGANGRQLNKIIQYVYAESRLVDKNFSIHDAIKWAEVLFEFDENRWLIDNLKTYVEQKYEKYLLGWPNNSTGDLSFAEVMALNVFHDDHDMDNLIRCLAGYGVLKTQPDWDSNYIYFRSMKTSDLSSENKKRYVVKKSDYKWFFWMDVGGWSPNSAIVGIVTPHEVAMYNIYGSSKDIATCHRKRPTSGTLASDILKSLGEALPGGAVFYQDLRNIGPIKTPVTNDEIIFVIPDLHLHLFKGFSADNFKQPGSGDKPLDKVMANVLSVIDKYKSEKTLRIIQVGDLYELWESAMLLCIGLNPDWNCVNATFVEASIILPDLLRPDREEMVNYIKSIEAEAERRKLHEAFSKAELDKFRLRWTDSSLKDGWKKIQQETEKLHQVLFKKGTLGEFNIFGNKTIIAGNHDSFLGYNYTFEEGINSVIRFEHLHYNDEYNKPSNMEAGQFMTILNLIAETKGFGDQVKALETSRRPEFLRDVATINHERYKQDKPMYDLIITGHTHRAYAQLIRMKLSRSTLFIESDASDVKYNQGWQKERTFQQTSEILRLAIVNRNAVLGGMGAMGWRGLAAAFSLWISGVKPSKPFPV